ncbi:hypothetical protein ACQPZA_20235 [Pseudonocardia xinjiangensis]|uniref:hypothetical protein n=1 Tax=Pseudonocardia xinjiangensis TaxID=75289 RepID=UPI003D8B57B7
MPASVITLDRACELARTGDVWIFRGRSPADRAIRGITNAPVNHVGMALVVDDLPPLMWHAELGRSLPDLWSGTHQRGVQLHDLRDAVLQWGHRYDQRAWLRQLDGPLSRDMEDAALRTVARLDGTPFPSTARLAGRWLRGRLPALRRPGGDGDGRAEPAPGPETAYCAEVVAVTYEEMGLLAGHRSPSWYDPGRFWSGDELDLVPGFQLGGEIAVTLPPAPARPRAAATPSRRAAWRPALRLRRHRTGLNPPAPLQ